MRYLEKIVRESERTIWALRSHVGEASAEEPFFAVVAERLAETKRPIEDFRRNIQLVGAEATRRHLCSLIDNFAACTCFKVKYFDGLGPRVDIIIVDGSRAVIGLPMADARGNSYSIVLTGRAVQGVEEAFRELWKVSNALFEGDPLISDERRQALKEVVNEEVRKAALSARIVTTAQN
jgi:hypothetical protein